MINKSDSLTETKTTVDEKISPYFTDVFTPWETKEQLVVWEEVATPWVFKWTIDTDTISVTTDNVYNLSIANPDWEIFSMGITWWGNYQENVFKIGYFNNSALAYSTLETDLQDWLSPEYTITYVSWTNFTIQRLDKQELTISDPDSVRNIELLDTDEYSITEITVDGVLVTLDGSIQTTDADAITYLESQLSTVIYYMFNNWNDLVIARKDMSIPVITSFKYDRYTYTLWYKFTDSISSWQFLDYLTTTVDWTEYKNFWTWVNRTYRGNHFASNLTGTVESIDDITTWSNSYSITTADGVCFIVRTTCKFTEATKNSSSTATRAVLTDNLGTPIATASFSWDVATFDEELAPWTYYIKADDNWSSYTAIYRITSWKTYNIGLYVYVDADITGGYVRNILSFQTKQLLDEDQTLYDISIDDTYWNWSYFSVKQADYSAMSISNVNRWTDQWSFPDDSFWTSIVSSSHNTTVNITTYTEIAKSETLTSNNYFVPVWIRYTKIEVSAISSWWSSEWIYELRSQSCTTKYSSTTTFVSDKIFKTDASNYWEVVLVKRGWFVITFTTDTSNKLNFTCS